MENTNDQNPSSNDAADQKDLMGGTTNLSLNQLKEESGIANFFEGNPDQVSDEDDLNEIKAGDDLNEPDPESSDNLEATGAVEDDKSSAFDQDRQNIDTDLDQENMENSENNF